VRLEARGTEAETRLLPATWTYDIAEDGTFRFESVRPGSYVLEVRVPTLGSAAQRVVVRPGEETEVEVEVTPGSHFEELVVSATGELVPVNQLVSYERAPATEQIMRVDGKNIIEVSARAESDDMGQIKRDLKTFEREIAYLTRRVRNLE